VDDAASGYSALAAVLEALIDASVTEVRLLQHAFNAGVRAQKGIEW
jgi:ATP:corrinoid adenosyltransferase